MNKAFVREPDADVRVTCPLCGSLGTTVGTGPMDTHVASEDRGRIGDVAWCCGNEACRVVYFNIFEQTVTVDQLRKPVYPYDLNSPICECFGLTWDDVDQDSREPIPVRIRELIAKSRTAEARCTLLALNGQCCVKEVQRLYFKLRSTEPR